MPTNFPTSLDDSTTLGPTFINDVAVTDNARQIDAALRTNTKDAVFAVEARIGVTNSAVTSSLAWATMSIGGVDNQGLRIAGGGNAAWPGSVGEDGIFLDSGTGFPAFHRSGEAVGTFYQLASAASAMSLQNSYVGGNTITTTGANDIAFVVGATEDFTVTHTADSKTIIATTARTATDGLLDINCTAIGATDVMAVNITSQNTANNQEVGCCLATLDQDGDLADTEIHYSYAAALDMSGDGPGSGLALGAGFYAQSAAFTGSNNYESVGLLVDNTFDWGVYSDAPIRINGPATGRALEMDSDPSLGDGSITVANATGASSRLLQLYSGTLAGIGTTAVERFTVHTNGTTSIYCDAVTNGLYVEQDGAGGLLYLYDLTNTAARLAVNKDGTSIITASTAATAAPLTLEQGATTEELLSFDGTYSATAASGNITDEDAGGAVVGPGTTTWTFQGMVKINIASGVMAGDYWIPLYN